MSKATEILTLVPAGIRLLFARDLDSPDLVFVEGEFIAGKSADVGEWTNEGGYDVLTVGLPLVESLRESVAEADRLAAENERLRVRIAELESQLAAKSGKERAATLAYLDSSGLAIRTGGMRDNVQIINVIYREINAGKHEQPTESKP